MNLLTPLQQFLKRAQDNPTDPYLHQPKDGKWTTYNWAEVKSMAQKIAAGLQAQGLQRGDKVAILGKNCAEWLVSDIAIAMAGMISVPIYYTAKAETIRYVLEHSGSKLLFIGKLDNFNEVEEAVKLTGHEVTTVAYPYPSINAQHNWNDWLNNYEPLSAIVESNMDEIYTLVYTSGSTGKPKGVILTNKNLATVPTDILKLMDLSDSHRVLSYLPMAHITERSIVSMNSLYAPFEIFFNESLDTFINDLRHTKPTFFLSVPRLWAKFQSQVLAQIPDKRLQFLLKIPFIGNRVAAKIRNQLGFDHCILYGSGSAPISPSLLRWFQRLGIEIAEAWGMTETSGGVISNIPFNNNFVGSIGVPLPNTELKAGENDELLIRGDAIFTEYYNNPEATAESFVDGWFRTGDRAKQNSDGSWSIIGRVKEQFKTAKGKYVAPVPIESLLGSNTLIEQSCVLGSGHPQPVALIVVNEQSNVDEDTITDSLEQTRVETNGQLESHQRLSNLFIVKEAFDISNNLLTPTLKLKRPEIEAQYKKLIEQEHQQSIVWEKQV